jgi:D-serine deaminase-like pyridoxal phosphate-dependent protein
MSCCRWRSNAIPGASAPASKRQPRPHGFLDLTRSNTRPVVGDVVRIVPNHVCVVVNMMDGMVMVRGEEIIGALPVAARGKLR